MDVFFTILGWVAVVLCSGSIGYFVKWLYGDSAYDDGYSAAKRAFSRPSADAARIRELEKENLIEARTADDDALELFYDAHIARRTNQETSPIS